MKRYLPLLYLPWAIEFGNYMAARFFMPDADWLPNLVGWALAAYVGFQAVGKYGATVWVAGLLGMTLVALDFFLGVILLPFSEVPEGWTGKMQMHSILGYVIASLMYACISGGVAWASGWINKNLRQRSQ